LKGGGMEEDGLLHYKRYEHEKQNIPPCLLIAEVNAKAKI